MLTFLYQSKSFFRARLGEKPWVYLNWGRENLMFLEGPFVLDEIHWNFDHLSFLVQKENRTADQIVLLLLSKHVFFLQWCLHTIYQCVQKYHLPVPGGLVIVPRRGPEGFAHTAPPWTPRNWSHGGHREAAGRFPLRRWHRKPYSQTWVDFAANCCRSRAGTVSHGVCR